MGSGESKQEELGHSGSLKKGKEISFQEKQNELYGEFDLTFMKNDKEKKGFLYPGEFSECVKDFKAIFPEKVDELIELESQILIDDDNRIGLDEFRILMFYYIKKTDPFKEILDVFKIFDKDTCKEITEVEIAHVFDKLGLSLSKDDINILMSEADTVDRDKKIEFEEFIRIMITK